MTLRSRQSQRSGQVGQNAVLLTMRAMGYRMVEPVFTGMKKIRGTWVFAGKVSGDIRAIEGQGRSVLVEVKRRMGGRSLCNSDFERHQMQALADHHYAGGASLIAWVGDHGVAIFPWRPLLLAIPGDSMQANELPGMNINRTGSFRPIARKIP